MFPVNLSIVIPTKNEPKIDLLVRRLRRVAHPLEIEIIVVDASDDPFTRKAAKREADIVLKHPRPSRGEQMRLGATHASAPLICFLHADSLLPNNFGKQISEAFAHPEVSYAAFHKSFPSAHPLLRLTAWYNNLWGRYRHVTQGDHGLVVRKEVLDAVGGMPDLALTEDLVLSRRLSVWTRQHEKRFVLMPGPLRSSIRFYQKHGVWGGFFIHKCIWFLFTLGYTPDELYRFYYAHFSAARHAREISTRWRSKNTARKNRR